MQVQVHSVHFDADAQLLEFIQSRLSKLEQFHDQIIGTEVFLRLDKSDVNENKVAEIRMAVPREKNCLLKSKAAVSKSPQMSL